VASQAGFTVSRIGVGNFATAVAADPATRQVYVGDASGVTVIDAGTNTVKDTISLGGYVALDLAVDAAAGTIYVAGYDSHGSTSKSAILVIDAATDAVTATIAQPANTIPIGIAVDPLHETVYVTNRYPAGITVLDAATDTISQTINLQPNGAAEGIAVDQATGTAYVTGVVAGSHTWALWSIDGGTDAVTDPVDLGTTSTTAGGGRTVSVNASTGTVYAANADDDLQVIDGTTDTVTGSVAMAPYDVAVDQVTGTIFGIAPTLTLAADDASDAVFSAFQRGGGAAADPGTGTMYIASDGQNVWAVTPSATNTMSPVFTGGAEAIFTAGSAGTYALQASAAPPATFSATGTLPAGLSLSPDGGLSGTPASGAGGTYDIQVTAANGVAPSVTEDFAVEVHEAPAITSPPRATFRTGAHDWFDVTASGSPASTFSENGALPAGVGMSADGQIAGTPQAGTAGRYRITITASNGVGTPATQAFTLTVDQVPRITSPASAAFRAGVKGTFTVTAVGFPAPHLSELFRLPAGLSFKPGPHCTALITGKPARSGTHLIVVIAKNSAGQARQTLLIVVRK
jgi:YVTN family beta-propeller protein